MRILLPAAALLALAACGPAEEAAAPASAGDSHLDCAALISAADHLIADGVLPADAEFQGQLLVAAMTHLNAYAIPEGIAETEAFKELNLRRGELMDTQSAEGILARAKSCVADMPD
ncbi:MAG: hypothetical protein KDA53_09415 [Hyphomonas sp.]|nr:hypothetical protein [Hyphomonas sp.]